MNVNFSDQKAIIAMSGGVDSSVAAYLMQKNGYDCIGVTMRLFDNGDIGISKGHTCCSLDDVEDARSVARRLGIPYYVVGDAKKAGFALDAVYDAFHACFDIQDKETNA